MFDLSWSELLVIAVVAIIVVGPKDLPRALRAVGRWSGKARRMARDFQNQFNEALREAELDSVKKEVESIAKIDPMADVRKEVREIETGLNAPAKPKTETPVASAVADPELAEIASDKGTDEPPPVVAEETAPAKTTAGGNP